MFCGLVECKAIIGHLSHIVHGGASEGIPLWWFMHFIAKKPRNGQTVVAGNAKDPISVDCSYPCMDVEDKGVEKEEEDKNGGENKEDGDNRGRGEWLH